MSALTGATAGSVPCAKRRSLLQEHKLGLGLSRVLYVHSDALRGPDFEVPSKQMSTMAHDYCDGTWQEHDTFVLQQCVWQP